MRPPGRRLRHPRMRHLGARHRGDQTVVGGFRRVSQCSVSGDHGDLAEIPHQTALSWREQLLWGSTSMVVTRSARACVPAARHSPGTGADLQHPLTAVDVQMLRINATTRGMPAELVIRSPTSPLTGFPSSTCVMTKSSRPPAPATGRGARLGAVAPGPFTPAFIRPPDGVGDELLAGAQPGTTAARRGAEVPARRRSSASCSSMTRLSGMCSGESSGSTGPVSCLAVTSPLRAYRHHPCPSFRPLRS